MVYVGLNQLADTLAAYNKQQSVEDVRMRPPLSPCGIRCSMFVFGGEGDTVHPRYGRFCPSFRIDGVQF